MKNDCQRPLENNSSKLASEVDGPRPASGTKGSAPKAPPVRKRKKIPKTVQFEEEVWLALEAHMKRERIFNHSMVANDAIKYALFPEHRNDRNADSTKIFYQILYSLNEHRKKTARDLAIIQEMLGRFVHAYFMHTHQIPASEKGAMEAQANVRFEAFMELVVRELPKAKPMVEGDAFEGKD